MITPEEISVIQGMTARYKADINALIERKPGPQASVEMLAAQNAIRDCMKAVLNECVPIDVQFCGELAIRLASYAISVAPIEDQDNLVALVVMHLRDTHRDRLRAGVVIKSDWEILSGMRRNIPDKGDVQ